MDHKIHYLKTWPDYFEESWEGVKRFEYRKDDRGFSVGDTLILQEYIPQTQVYTGRDLMAVVTCIVRQCPGLAEGYCIMGIDAFGIRHGEEESRTTTTK